MTELQKEKKYWPGLKHGEAQREKRVRRRKERHRQNSAILHDSDPLPKVPMPYLD